MLTIAYFGEVFMDPMPLRPIVPQTLGSVGQRIVLIAVGGMFVLVGALGLTDMSDPASDVINVAVLAVGAWVVFRGFLLGLRVDAKGVIDRGIGRSRAVPWCAIREVETDTLGLGAVRTGSPGLVLKSGEKIPLKSLASYSHRATKANLFLLKDLHAQHLSACPDCA